MVIYLTKANKEKIMSIRASHVDRINDDRWNSYKEAYKNLEGIKADFFDFSGDRLKSQKQKTLAKLNMKKLFKV